MIGKLKDIMCEPLTINHVMMLAILEKIKLKHLGVLDPQDEHHMK
jgi:hypothetical protein